MGSMLEERLAVVTTERQEVEVVAAIETVRVCGHGSNDRERHEELSVMNGRLGDLSLWTFRIPRSRKCGETWGIPLFDLSFFPETKGLTDSYIVMYITI